MNSRPKIEDGEAKQTTADMIKFNINNLLTYGIQEDIVIDSSENNTPISPQETHELLLGLNKEKEIETKILFFEHEYLEDEDLAAELSEDVETDKIDLIPNIRMYFMESENSTIGITAIEVDRDTTNITIKPLNQYPEEIRRLYNKLKEEKQERIKTNKNY